MRHVVILGAGQRRGVAVSVGGRWWVGWWVGGSLRTQCAVAMERALAFVVGVTSARPGAADVARS